MGKPEQISEGRVEKLARINTKKSLLILGGAAVGSGLLPPVGAAVAVTIAAGAGIEAVGSKMLHMHRKEKRIKTGSH